MTPLIRVLATLLLLTATACVGMVRIKQPESYFDSSHPKIVRVTDPTGNQFIMVGAHLEHDTLMGFVQHSSGIHEFQEVAMTDISKVEAEQRDHTKTAIAIGVGVAGFTVAWYALYRQASKEGTSQFCVDGLYSGGIPC
jgi:hypothetical protein